MLKRDTAGNFKKKKKGQSTVEYIILVAGVLAIILVFLAPGGLFQQAYNRTMITGINGMEEMAGALSTSHEPVNP